jgi:4-aminobutyrate aminotransferase-like enzyme
VVNRVINLETGSLAAEAAVKMMLARFYRQDVTVRTPVYADRVPVFLVVGDFDGGPTGNYHGTTVLTQILRGMWPELADRLREQDLYRVVPVGINDVDSFRAAIETYDRGRYKVAGFLHEIVLMNYGGIRLEQGFLQEAYALCHEHDIPVLVDEIQSCAWSPQLFMYREYDLAPDFVAVGKGFPGGNSPASRILVSADLDSLNQFGALVTNGQEELSSLYYLVTMAYVEAYQEHLLQVGEYYRQRLEDLARRHDRVVAKIEGIRHLSAVFFHTPEQVKRFVGLLTEGCIDISAQTYKPKCPPAALTKLPVITTQHMVDVLVGRMDAALEKL